MTAPLDLAALEAVARAATPGPGRAGFITAFSPDVALALLAEVAALRASWRRVSILADGQRALAEQAELRVEHVCRQRDAARADADRMRGVVVLAQQYCREPEGSLDIPALYRYLESAIDALDANAGTDGAR